MAHIQGLIPEGLVFPYWSSKSLKNYMIKCHQIAKLKTDNPLGWNSLDDKSTNSNSVGSGIGRGGGGCLLWAGVFAYCPEIPRQS